MHPTRRFLLGPRSSSYYSAGQRQGEALIRARKPYLIKNTLTGAAIVGLTASIYIYTIRAVSQDEFEDVPIPDVPVQNPTEKTPDGGSADTGV